jgi:hypothetical protein
VANKRFAKTFTPPPPPPLSCVHEKFSRRLRMSFKWFVFYFEPKWYTGGFSLPSATNVVNFSVRTILQWSTLGYCNLNWLNTYENEEVAFIGQRSGEPLKWRQFDEISRYIISKINTLHCFHTSWNLAEIFFSHLSLCKSNKVQQLDDICETRR